MHRCVVLARDLLLHVHDEHGFMSLLLLHLHSRLVYVKIIDPCALLLVVIARRVLIVVALGGR